MADPPRLTTTRCQMGRSERWSTRQAKLEESELKTWPATPVESLEQGSVSFALDRSCFQEKGSSRGRSAIQKELQIPDPGFWISTVLKRLVQISNRELEIGNTLCCAKRQDRFSRPTLMTLPRSLFGLRLMRTCTPVQCVVRTSQSCVQ
jgi:hypothetical protein